MNQKLRSILLGSTSIVAALGSMHSASAQQDVLETVIVTAEKQAADIQKTSISISAIQPDNIKGDGKVLFQDVIPNVAGVSIRRSARTEAVPSIRGIVATTGESTVATIDQTYATGAEVEMLGMFDVARIEVLRGPQATLYGRNAEIGAVNIYTKDPVQNYEGNVFIQAGDYNMVAAQGVVNIPLTDTLAMRVGFNNHQETGPTHPAGAGVIDFSAVRAKFLYKPSDDFQIHVSAGFANNMWAGGRDVLPQRTKIANWASPAFGGFNPCGGSPILNIYDPWHSPALYTGAYPCTVPAQPPVNPNPVTGVCQRVARTEENFYRADASVDWDFGWSHAFAVVNHTNFNNSTAKNQISNVTGTWTALWQPQQTTIFEGRLSSPADQMWRWVTGVYYQKTHSVRNIINQQVVTGVCAPRGCNAPTDATSIVKAVFGQTTYPITDDFRVVAGLRYAEDSLASTAWRTNVASHAIIGAFSRSSFKWPTWTYKGGLEYDLAEQNMVYANVATGFRQGGSFNDAYCYNAAHVAVAPLPPPAGGCPAGSTLTTVVNGADPDKIRQYEVGSKNRFLDNKLEVNAAAFHYTLTNFFVSALGLSHANQTASLQQAVKGAKGYGAELETTFLASPNDRFDINLAYLKTRIGEDDNPFNIPSCYNFGIATHPQIEVLVNTINRAACSPKNLAANPATVNWVRYYPALHGSDPLPNAPTWAGNVSYSHIFDLSSGATVTAKASVHFESSTVTAILPYYDAHQGSYHTTDASVTYDTADGKWSFAAWVRNIENQFVNNGVGNVGGGIAPVYVFVNSPRTWGVNLNARF